MHYRLLFLLILFISEYGFSQAIVKYKVKLDTTNDLYQKKKHKAYIIATKHISELNFILKYNGNEANYYMEDIMTTENTYGITNSVDFSEGFKFIYSNLNDGMSYFRPLSNSEKKEKIVIADSLNKNWRITNQTKNINGFNCLKATGEIKVTKPDKGKSITIEKKPIDVEAWFAPSIAIPLGPKGFGALPGLILELKYDKFYIYAKKIDLNPKQKIKIERIEGDHYMSEADFIEMRVDAKLKELKASGIDINKF
jgi:GLPGLI family protein